MTAQDIQTKALQRIRADVRAMQGYHVQPAQGLLKMDTMENPYRLSVDLQKQLGERLGSLSLQLKLRPGGATLALCSHEEHPDPDFSGTAEGVTAV